MTDNEKPKHKPIDPRVEEEIEEVNAEEEIFGSYTNDGQAGEKINTVNNWLPDDDNWQGKTIVNEREARLFALARALPHAFPEIEEKKPFIDEMLTNLEMYKTSVKGVSREQQVSVIGSMFGSGEEDSSVRSALAGFIAGGEENDD